MSEVRQSVIPEDRRLEPGRIAARRLVDFHQRAYEQFYRLTARELGIVPWDERTESEKLQRYLLKPPVGPDGRPPPHQEGVPHQFQAPCWGCLAAEMPKLYEERLAEFIKLVGKFVDQITGGG